MRRGPFNSRNDRISHRREIFDPPCLKKSVTFSKISSVSGHIRSDPIIILKLTFHTDFKYNYLNANHTRQSETTRVVAVQVARIYNTNAVLQEL